MNITLTTFTVSSQIIVLSHLEVLEVAAQCDYLDK